MSVVEPGIKIYDRGLKMYSQNIYHRVYQLIKRNIDMHVIATMLNLPLRTVLNVIAKIEKNGGLEKNGLSPADDATAESPVPVFLDTYLLPRNRYAILQLVGFMVEEMKEKLEQELLAVKVSTWRIVALQLTEVTALDETCAGILFAYCEEMKSRDRYIALLDPPMELESILSQFKFEGNVPIFGTKWAFEEEALNSKGTSAAFNLKNRSSR